MSRLSKKSTSGGHRYALCIGIGTYTELHNRNLQYASKDAAAIAEKLGDPERGNFKVTLLTEPDQTTERMLVTTLDAMLNGKELKAEDLVLVYLSCHGDIYGKGNTFYLLPSNTEIEANGMPKKLTVIDIYSLSSTLSGARVKNIIFLLDVCHSGGAGAVLEHLNLNLNPDANLFIIGAARHDQLATQSSQLKHGVFTSCLLKAFEQQPTRSDGWLTISDIHSFVSEAIKTEKKRLTGQESPVEIQARSASVNPNLLLVKNPHYSSGSRKFHKAVKNLLDLIQYKPIQTVIPPEAPAGFYIAELKFPLHILRIGVIPYYNRVEPLTLEDAEKMTHFLKQQVEQGNLDEGLIVVSHEVSNDIKRPFSNSSTRHLDIRTYENIQKNLIDFSAYLQKLVNEYQNGISERQDNPPLAKVYIPLCAERRSYNIDLPPTEATKTHLTSDTTKEYEIGWKGDLEGEVRGWLANKDSATSRRLVLLADYGSGKTTFCQHLAAMMAKDYLEALEHERYEKRIPLIIPLREFGKNPADLKGYLVAHLKQYCHVDNADAEALLKMAEAGLLLFILDGFDEMASRATNDTMSMNIEQFELLAGLPQNKLFLTTRPEYFLNLSQERQILQTYSRLYLKPLNEKQVDLYLKNRIPFLHSDKSTPKRSWKYYRKQIDSIHDLSDLVRRPVLLEMIIKTLPVLIIEGKTVNRPNLYQRYLEGELDRQVQKQRRDLLIKREKRFEIIERIALELYRTDKTEMSSKQILEISRELLTTEMQEEMEGSLREIVTCSFLIRTGNEYRFSHQSFWEYLVACRLAKDVMKNKVENLRLKLLTRTIRDFLLELEIEVVQKSSTSTSTNNIFTSFNQKQLEEWFCANPQDSLLSSNIISLLAKLLSPDQLHRLPLQGASLQGANLQGANLQGADLRRAFLLGAQLQKADLRRAFLLGAQLQKADLRRAFLQEAHLPEANLEKADLQGANLQGALLQEANLRGVNLQGADLREANLQGAQLQGAQLPGVDL